MTERREGEREREREGGGESGGGREGSVKQVEDRDNDTTEDRRHRDINICSFHF